MLTDDQRVLLEDKYVLWVRASETGPVDLRDYNRRAADALRTALAICSAGLPTLADGWEWVACPISERWPAAPQAEPGDGSETQTRP